MRSGFALYMMLVCASMTLAGCLADTDDLVAGATHQGALSDFEGCWATYPDGVPEACQDVYPRLPVHRTAPDEAYCTSAGAMDIRYDPVAGTHWFSYDLGTDTAFDNVFGTLTLTIDGTAAQSVHGAGASRGWIEVPTGTSADDRSIEVVARWWQYGVGIRVDAETFNAADHMAVVSVYDELPWVVHRFDAADTFYTFSNHLEVELSFDAQTIPTYQSGDVMATGDGFLIDIDMRHADDVSASLWWEDLYAPATDCV